MPKVKKVQQVDTLSVDYEDKPTLDEEGYVVNPKTGERDGRYRKPYSLVIEKRRRGKPRIDRKERLAKIFDPTVYAWELIDEGFSPIGVRSASGSRLRHYYVLRDNNTGQQVYAGKGELVKYAKVKLPEVVGKSKLESFGGAFAPVVNDYAAWDTEDDFDVD